MTETTLNAQHTFDQLPPIWPTSLLAEIRAIHKQSGKRLVILDDDPTGTQTVHGVPLLTEWSVKSLRNELKQSNVFFVLTNSRSLPEEEAVALALEIGQNLLQAAELAGVTYTVLSRSDSTLRGHFPAEVDALCQGMGRTYDATIMVPYFKAGGRYTLNNIHYVQQGEQLVPASQTEFADDKAFPFTHSFLPKYVEEKTKGRIKSDQVYGLSLQTIREGGPPAVKAALVQIPKGAVIIINAADDRDIEVAVKGIYLAQASGKAYIYRTAASFVRVLAGIEERPLLHAQNMATPTSNGGILFVGSHIQKSTAQLRKALAIPNVFPVEIDVEKLLNEEWRASTIAQNLSQITAALESGQHVVAFTSRKLIASPSASTSLAISRVISNSMCEMVRRLKVQPRFLIAKGGITSNDIATKGLQVKRALIAGQLQPGVPVWILGAESKFPGMHYVVYPGNVGSENGLAEALLAFDK
ncbi:MAG: four-carbon acid sugar kinase family protein [Saprospiraceae bacterium]